MDFTSGLNSPLAARCWRPSRSQFSPGVKACLNAVTARSPQCSTPRCWFSLCWQPRRITAANAIFLRNTPRPVHLLIFEPLFYRENSARAISSVVLVCVRGMRRSSSSASCVHRTSPATCWRSRPGLCFACYLPVATTHKKRAPSIARLQSSTATCSSFSSAAPGGHAAIPRMTCALDTL